MRPWKMPEEICRPLTLLTWTDMDCLKSSLTYHGFFSTMTRHTQRG
jgi:hypothetical protein